MNRAISRRTFSKTALLSAAGALAPIPWDAAAQNLPASDATNAAGAARTRYRAVSWWLTWEDLTWPNPELMDKIRRRADSCSQNGVNCCLFFGAHFRWDFMPLWGRLHDQLRFISDELHKRNILFFDHHSSVLTHRPRNREESQNIWRSNRHHVPFYPSLTEAATWEYNGSRLNEWRMLDVETGEPIYLPEYNAEQFCMNNPAFRAAYAKYVQRLHADTGIDGLMSDDNIFYANWRACSCSHCRGRFEHDYGHRLPPVSDTSFWGNLASEPFKDWIAMRFQSSTDFLAVVQDTLPKNFPMLSCCSSSDGYYLPAFGMTYQDFIQHCNHVLLEMVGSTPSVTGTWDERIPSQLLHLGIARDHKVPCLGLGYGFFPDTAFFVWAINKFLGSDSWFSTLKGRLNATPEELASLADDPELVGEGYRWEREHPQLFGGQIDTDVAVYFSRSTRDFYGQVEGDYSADYSATCLALTRAGISCNIVTDIPRFGSVRCLVLSSAVCLSTAQRNQLEEFARAGGLIVATGPNGFCDGRGNRTAHPWLRQFGIDAELSATSRPGGFPPYKNFKAPVEIAMCVVSSKPREGRNGDWQMISISKGSIAWEPARISQKDVATAVAKLLKGRDQTSVRIAGLPETWRLRQFRDGARVLIHSLPHKVETHLHPSLKNQMNSERIVTEVRYGPNLQTLTLESPVPLRQVVLHSPDLGDSRSGTRAKGDKWVVDAAQVRRYFVLECLAS